MIGEDISCGEKGKYGLPTHYAMCPICKKLVETNCWGCISGDTVVHNHPNKTSYDGVPDFSDNVKWKKIKRKFDIFG